MVARGVVSWGPRQPERDFSRPGQGGGRDEMGDSEFPGLSGLVSEIHSGLLQDSRTLDPINKESRGLSVTYTFRNCVLLLFKVNKIEY